MEYNHLEYVRKYFQLYYGTYYNRLGKNEVDSLCMGISKRIRDKYNDFKLVQEGVADKFISSVINSYVNKEHKELRADYINLRNYATQVVRDGHFIYCSEKTLDLIIEEICDMLMPTYTYSRMNDGKMDEEIMACYNFVLSGLCDEMRAYVSSYISDNIVPLTDIDNVVVEDEIIRLVLNTCEVNSFDLLLGRLDAKINEIAVKNREENKTKRLSEMPDTVEYIKSAVEIYTDDMELVNRIASRVDMDLRDEGLTPNEIVSKKYDMKIRKMFNDYYSKSRNLFIENSIETEDAPSKIELVGGKKNINKIIAELLVASALLGLISYGGHALGKEIRNSNAEDNLKKFDSYSYSPITSIYVNPFNATAENIIKTYDDYCQFDNPNFSYLAFYQAYDSVTEKKLYVMDNMLAEIKDDIYAKVEYSDLMNMLRSNACYLDFIYDRLYDMGFTEIKENKYNELLAVYVDAKNAHQYRDPVEYLSGSQQRLLNKVLEKYEELSEQYLLEFGVLLGNQNNTLEETTSVRRS